MPTSPPRSERFCRDTLDALSERLETFAPALSIRETGLIRSLRPGIATVGGLAGVQSDELVAFPAGASSPDAQPLLGIAFNLDAEEVGVILLGEGHHLQAGNEVHRTGRVVEVPVGEALLGRMITVLGHPLDGRGPLNARERRRVEREAPAILDRGPVQRPLLTGWKVIDALIPIGRGQRELIIGDRQTGKTSIAVDAILSQRERGVICIYCAIGQRSADTAGVVATLQEHGAMETTTVVVAAGQDPPGLHYITPYGATAMAEYFMERGEDVLIVYDDLTHHARTYRELSLLLRRPPGREAYPGDIFYLHSRLLERSTQLRPELGGGSITALPIIETQAQNISAYIPTNLISITDGQIYLSSDLYRKSLLPAVDVGRSVSRVGGKTQPEVLRSVSSELRLSYAQFEETEIFTRFGTQLDEETKGVIERGRRIRELLRQRLHQPLTLDRQAVLLLALDMGLLDEVPVERIEPLEPRLQAAAEQELPELCRRLRDGESPGDEEREALRSCLADAIAEGD